MSYLVVDIGNTCTHLGVNEKGSWVVRLRIGSYEDPIKWLKVIDRKTEYSIISSVVPQVRDEWKNALKIFSANTVELRYSENLGIKVNYDKKESLGTDRIANALFVGEKVKRNSVVVDIGTAITVDAVDREGNFLGGSIIPGIYTAFSALTKGAAQLVGHSFEFTFKRVPGRSTRECMSLGILRATFFGIIGLAKETAESLGWKEWIGLYTGGGASLFFPLFQETNWIYEPMLTLEGILIGLLKMLQKRT